MMIEIIEANLQLDDDLNIELWSCWLEINQASEAYLLPVTAPGTLLEVDLQAHFDAKEAALFAVAQGKGFDVGEIYNLLTKRILKAVLLVILDEINILRGLHGLAERTPAQARTAVKNKLQTF
jgi:hypothetical protein